MGAVETLAVGRGLRIGEIERAAAEPIGLEGNPGFQVGAGLNDHVGAGRADHVENKHTIFILSLNWSSLNGPRFRITFPLARNFVWAIIKP